ncbi:hypothetical protein [Streptomyces prunicolor]
MKPDATNEPYERARCVVRTSWWGLRETRCALLRPARTLAVPQA